MSQTLTQDWWLQPKTCTLGCLLNQPLMQPWMRECYARSSDMHQHLTQMKSETASFPHASATDSINIRDCKFLAPATNLASASDSLTSETASLQHPAAASSTAASNLLRATKKLSYGSSLGGPDNSMTEHTENWPSLVISFCTLYINTPMEVVLVEMRVNSITYLIFSSLSDLLL